MGLKPIGMMVLPDGVRYERLSFPSEWLLNVFEQHPRRRFSRPYVYEIQVPKSYTTFYSCGALACFLTLIGILVYWIV